MCGPQYRRRVIVGNVEKRLKSLLIDKCKQSNLDIISADDARSCSYIPQSGPTITPNRIVAALKGYIHLEF